MKILEEKFRLPLKSLNLIGFTNELKAMYVNFCFQEQKKSIIFVTSTLYEANQLYRTISNYSHDVLFFPMDDFLTSEIIAMSPELKVKRLETLIESLSETPKIVITNLMGYLRFLPMKKNFKKSIITLTINSNINMNNLLEHLIFLGYTREMIVNKTGEFAVRGFIIDIFPINFEHPVRIEFFGDEIESIRIFNVDNQLTTKVIDEITIYPNTEDIIDSSMHIENHYEIAQVTETTNISNYFESPIVFFNDYTAILKSHDLLLKEIYEYNMEKNISQNIMHMNDMRKLHSKIIVNFTNFDDNLDITSECIQLKAKMLDLRLKSLNDLKEILLEHLKSHKTIVVALNDRYKANSIEEFIEELNPVLTNEQEIYENRINIIVKKMNCGFEYENYVFITQNDLFNTKESEDGYKSKFRFGTKIKDITKLEIGDYVVHYVHGIGRYVGLKTLNKNGLNKDYLQIEYRDSDKLYIPVEKIDFISKYSSGDGIIPKINKLGGTEWEKTKLRVRKKVEDIATDLLKLYALREQSIGFAFPKDTDEQLEFERKFQYEDTIDQIKVLDEIKKDMEKSNPMDRLLCGDVGYGKTEVAFRAIFKAIMGGKQVALLCPTTILSNQHYQNALERFKDYPVNINLLNRFVSKKEATKVLQNLKEGKVDILIGTHRILSDDVQFKDLGLLVIDEEQRFGVKHKEKIKCIRNNVDVLTLSATPIPRTLQMSMSGLKSLSLIETPPTDRYPVQTYVLSQSNQIVKDAIYKELSRQGQVFILYNHIEDMESRMSELQQIVPEAKIIYAHGQMDKEKLENIMLAFINKEFDVLLCTTIIETGIDIPNANTLIIYDADRFGLSQLYQIRGRVGRSNRIAYCYLMYDKYKILSEIAEKRLKAIKDFTELGSGFAIAMRDLAIRGAGDILGSEQAGFVDSVGIDMFLKMLDEEVKRSRGEAIENHKDDSQPLVEVSTSIPDSYVQEDELKIYIHQRINKIDSVESINLLIGELEDRFGKLEKDIIIYMYQELFEKKASKLNIKDIKQTKNSIEVWLPVDLTNSISGEHLFLEVMKLSRMFRFSMKLKRLIITLDIVKLDKHYIYYLIDLMDIMEKARK
ncbi:MAG: transcription-repair coupling factor [Firmicutes bacterium]|nr:transcription-repair coupling factor [Bacillota bacterium]